MSAKIMYTSESELLQISENKFAGLGNWRHTSIAMLQCVAVCCGVLQCVTVCCGVFSVV